MSQKILDPQIVVNIAWLSRINAKPSLEFLEKFGKELGTVLEYVEQLKEVDISSVDSLLGSSRIITIDELAEDEPYPDQEEMARIRQNIIDNFPQKQGNLLVLPGSGIFDN